MPRPAPTAPAPPPPSRRRGLLANARGLARTLREDDTAGTEAILRLSRSHRALAPLMLVIGAFEMLLAGVRILLTNWRLMLVQVPPAMLVWLAMYDLKAHVLRGKSFHALRGPVLIPINVAIVALTIAAYFLNAVFAYAITAPPPPRVREAFSRARGNMRPILLVGGTVGAALGLSTTVFTRWERPWFTVSLSIVVGVMMVTYVAVPSRLIGVKPAASRRDRLAATAISSGISATVCAPPYLLARIGLLMLGSKLLLIPGILLFIAGAVLQAGATGAVRAIKMSVSLLAPATPAPAPSDSDAAPHGPAADADPDADRGHPGPQ